MPRPYKIFSLCDNLIQILDINSYTEWQTVQIQFSWLLRSHLIRIYTVCKGRVYLDSAGQGLNMEYNKIEVCQICVKQAYKRKQNYWCLSQVLVEYRIISSCLT